MVAVGYLFLGPKIYGKSSQGVLATLNLLLLLPYLLYLWSIWYLLRFVKRERAFDQLTDKIYVGRRLLSREYPKFIDHIVDLTCEFDGAESHYSCEYHSFQILDGFIPSIEQLSQWVNEIVDMSGSIYIHCAQGHGRTGLTAAAILVRTGQLTTPEEAIAFIKTKRPLVRLSGRQLQALQAFASA